MYLLPFYICIKFLYYFWKSISNWHKVKIQKYWFDILSKSTLYSTYSRWQTFVELSKLHICTTVVFFFFENYMQVDFCKKTGRKSSHPAIIPIKHFHNYSIIWISSQRKQDFAWPHTENQIIRPWYMYQLSISIIIICISS